MIMGHTYEEDHHRAAVMFVVRSGNLYVVEVNHQHYLAPTSTKDAKTWRLKGQAAFWRRYFQKFRKMEVSIEEVDV